MQYTNLTQATYDRLCEREENSEAQTNLDVADLLEAYESAVLLLKKMADTGAAVVTEDVFSFLYNDWGNPRVDIEAV